MKNRQILLSCNEHHNLLSTLDYIEKEIEIPIFPQSIDLSLFNEFFGVLLYKVLKEKYLKKSQEIKYWELRINEIFKNKHNSLNESINIFKINEYLRSGNFLGKYVDIKLPYSKANISKSLLRSAISIIHYSYDYFTGGIGLVFTVLEINNSFDLELDNLLLDFLLELEDISEYDINGGIKWASYNNKNECTCYNLGLAHGITSIIALFSKILRTPFASKSVHEKTSEMLLKTIKCLFSNVLDFDSVGCFFPNFEIQQNETIYKSRLAWCYGDLGISYTLFQASTVLNDVVLKEKAIEILLKTSSRTDYVSNNIYDFRFCHGTSGIAYIYKKLYESCDIEEFEKVSKYWLNESINMIDFGLENYMRSKHPKLKDDFFNNYKLHNGILEGYTGLGIVLLSFLCPEMDTSWDELLML